MRHIMSYIMLTIFSITMVSALPSIAAAQTEGIAAVVNDGAVSESDVKARMKLVVASSGMPNTAEIREKVRPQVLNILIDEQVRLQEAQRLGIDVTEEEVNQGIGIIASQNNLDMETFVKAMRQDGIKERTLRQQVRAQLAWNNVIQQEIRPKIEISEQQIDIMEERINSRTGTDEYLVYEIFLSVPDQNEERDVKQLANKLHSQIQQRKAPFERMAAQFSEGATASKGGLLGWIQEGQLSEELDTQLSRLDKGSVSSPIRSLSGYHILLVRDKRTLTAENAPSREDILNKIGLEEMDRRQRRYFLDLKAAAFIEKRS
jgi:peptidyl-prolyl cis-trans isomerase SurA